MSRILGHVAQYANPFKNHTPFVEDLGLASKLIQSLDQIQSCWLLEVHIFQIHMGNSPRYRYWIEEDRTWPICLGWVPVDDLTYSRRVATCLTNPSGLLHHNSPTIASGLIWGQDQASKEVRYQQGACSNFTFKFKDFSRTFKVQKCYFQAPYTDMPTCWMPKLYWISKTVFSHVKLYYSNKCSYDKFVRVKYMYNLPL